MECVYGKKHVYSGGYLALSLFGDTYLNHMALLSIELLFQSSQARVVGVECVNSQSYKPKKSSSCTVIVPCKPMAKG